jgi:mono/diheme cytochrome c family protein
MMITSYRLSVILICAVSLAMISCSEAETKPAPPSKPSSPGPTTRLPAEPPPPVTKPAKDDPAALVARGRAVYTANCIACHNVDPNLDGAIGPAVAFASAELIEAKVMRNEYPEGYTPKRPTRAMIALPYLEKDLPALFAYLNQ